MRFELEYDMISYTWKLCENCHGWEIVKYIFLQASIYKRSIRGIKCLGEKEETE